MRELALVTLMGEELKAAPDVVTSMYLYFLLIVSLFMIMFIHDMIREVPSQWYACSCLF